MRSDLAYQNAEIQTAIESLPQTEEDMDEFLVKVDLYNQYNDGRYEDITAGTNEILGKLPDARPIFPSIEVLEKRNRGLTVIRDKVYGEWKVLAKKVKAHEKRLEEEEEARKAAEVNAEATEGGETSAGDKPPQVS